ncbi:MAG TPA: hypothetical protein DEA08_31525 [Planctomycetes bacterium]|nr:hypothetical protein [Planctomycetota bacterium]
MSEDESKNEDAQSDEAEQAVGDAVGDAEEGEGKDDEASPPVAIIDTLDIARGDIDDADLGQLEEALNVIDFATRRASPERLAALKAMHGRLGDLIDQIERGERTARPEAEPLTDEIEARYASLIDQGLEAGQKRNFADAQQLFEEAVLINPEGIDGLFNLGVVYGFLAHHNIAKAEFYDDYTRDEIFLEKARICYDSVLNLEPDHLPSLNNLATLYSMRDDSERAIDYLERIVAATPADDREKALIAEAQVQLDELKSL